MKTHGTLKVCLLAVGLSLGTPAPGASAAKPDARITKARDLTKAGKYASAIAVYEAILKDRPTDRQVLIRVGPLYFLTADYERARYRFARVTRRRPRFAKGWYFYAYALRKLGQYDKALVAYRSYRKLSPKDPHAFYGMADCYRALGKDARAIQAYTRFATRAAQLHKGPDLKPWILRARREAERLESRLREKRSGAAVKALLARARKAVRDMKPLLAEKLLKAGLKQLKNPPLVANELAGLLIRMRRFSEALPLLRSALKKRKRFFDAQYRLALCLRKTGDLKGAAQAYLAVLKIKPDHPDSHYGLAETYHKLGKLKKALVVYQRYVVLEQRPEEQQWVSKARERIAAIQKQLAAGARPVAARPAAARPTSGGPPSLAGITDPRIRAMLLARQRFLKRQHGEAVEGSAGPATPRPAPGESAAQRRRRRREAARKRAAERRRKWLEARRRRAAERRRKREEAKRRYLEAKRKREEVRRRRAAERRRKRQEYRRKVARRNNERLAKRWLQGRGKLTPALETILREWAKTPGTPARAFQIWSRLAEQKPGDLALQRSLAAAATAAGEHRAAVKAYRQLVKAHPKRLPLYAKLRAQEAKAGLKLTPLPLAVVLPPVVLQGRKRLRAGQPAEALKLARARLRTSPRDALAWVLAGDAYLRLRLVKAARQAAQKAMSLDPKLAGPYRLLGGVHLKLRDRGEALRQFRIFLHKVGRDGTELPNRPLVRAMVKRLEE